MQLFYCPEINNSPYTLPEEESKHCIKVLRKNIGDKINIINGNGSLYECSIIELTKKSCTVEIISQKDNFGKNPYNLHIAIAPTKNNDRIEWFLEKSTEMGINTISFVGCDHSERDSVKIERLDKVLVSAIKQSIKAYKPILNPITKLDKFLAQRFDTDQLYIAHCDNETERIELKEIVDPSNQKEVVVLIGPEGDFSKREINLALSKGFKPVSFGNSRLRTETAALYATAVVNIKTI